MAEEAAATIVVVIVVVIAFLTSMNTKPDVHSSAIRGAAPAVVVCSALDLADGVGDSLAVSLFVEKVNRAMHDFLICFRQKEEAAAMMMIVAIAALVALVVIAALPIAVVVVVVVRVLIMIAVKFGIIIVVVVVTAQLASIHAAPDDVFLRSASHHAILLLVGDEGFVINIRGSHARHQHKTHRSEKDCYSAFRHRHYISCAAGKNAFDNKVVR